MFVTAMISSHARAQMTKTIGISPNSVSCPPNWVISSFIRSRPAQFVAHYRKLGWGHAIILHKATQNDSVVNVIPV